MSCIITPFGNNIIQVGVYTSGDTYTHIIAGNLSNPGISCDTISDLPAQDIILNKDPQHMLLLTIPFTQSSLTEHGLSKTKHPEWMSIPRQKSINCWKIWQMHNPMLTTIKTKRFNSTGNLLCKTSTTPTKTEQGSSLTRTPILVQHLLLTKMQEQ